MRLYKGKITIDLKPLTNNEQEVYQMALDIYHQLEKKFRQAQHPQIIEVSQKN